MTGTSVAQAAGLFPGSAGMNVAGMQNGNQGDGFSQIMSRTTKDTAGQMQGYQQNDKAAAARTPVKVDRSNLRETKAQETDKAAVAEDTQDANTAEVTEETQSAVEEAVSEVKDAIEEELGISEEELEGIMSELGLTWMDLLQPENIQDIVIAAAGGGDGLSILTDEGLYQSVQMLTGMVEETVEGLQEELGLEDTAFADLLLQMEEAAPVVTEAAPENAEEIPVIVSGEESVETAFKAEEAEEEETVSTTQFSEDTVKTTESVHTHAETTDKTSEKKEDTGAGQEQNSHFLQGFSRPGVEFFFFFYAMKPAEIPFEAMDTREVMEQVTEYVKLEAKPDVTEMELRLHPESLGTLHIHLPAKEGVVTAQFTAENEAVKTVLEAQAVQLKENLNQQGVKVEAVEVTIASHGFDRSFAENGGEESRYEEPRKRTARRIQLSDDVSLDEMELTEEERIAAEMMEQNGNTVDYMA